MTFAERLSQALAKRLYPCTPLSPKQAAHGIGVDKATLWRWKNDLRAMPAQKLLELDEFFSARGYGGFATEVMVSRGTTQERIVGTVERLPLDRLSIPAGQHLASLAASGGDLLTAGENAGGSILRVCGNDVIAAHLGSSAGLRQSTLRAFLGLPLKRWPDPAYGALVEGHVLEAHAGGATYYSLDVPAMDMRVRYRRAMFPAGDFVVSISERLAA